MNFKHVFTIKNFKNFVVKYNTLGTNQNGKNRPNSKVYRHILNQKPKYIIQDR